MTKAGVVIHFPNPTRIHDASRHCVCFWGYDKAREIAFQVDDGVLARLSPNKDSDESSLLAAFDRNRERILEIARTVYTGGPQNRYTIS
ncbi:MULTISPECIES: DUF1488 domain-containing protein [Paraburkholderia]|jgi:hypothetical protein|uniref:DUF1488 domain-containing protein n=1 Tax=Paraburkholderia caribensis TaxID=75105 RepID=A0A9Q6WR89_9BURK|nr:MULTISPECIES: DUF1488 domain-containing protein [Paraburkholderia]ALP66855.1 hypothetical protein AN416_29390 [Paraburkholderia caribensis]AMV47397.1 hypothetical protein ATN79_42765 [Paraburkholderia caribensis]AUT56554.1 DUF1488 domain-containing protein [Paraburkholderia caribensis]MCO4879469.1 DUF1488 domain-containing protein [Paraburkholderia caribensis]MDR6386901.1 hypothetical protein [Paraburkholderia caribensis]